MKFTLQRVHLMPKVLEPRILYVSDEFGTAAHLCASGCGEKIRTPLGPEEWQVKETPTGPTLRPSVGSWQLPCRSHYFITAGQVDWMPQWTQAQIEAGRRAEHERRVAHYTRQNRRAGPLISFIRLVKQLFGKS